MPKESTYRASSIIYASDIMRRAKQINEAIKIVEELRDIEDLKADLEFAFSQIDSKVLSS